MHVNSVIAAVHELSYSVQARFRPKHSEELRRNLIINQETRVIALILYSHRIIQARSISSQTELIMSPIDFRDLILVPISC